MFGIDVSNHNGTIAFGTAKENGGVQCVYVKATEGTTFVDPYLSQHYKGAIDANLLTGFYHFLVGTSAPETQAENFYNQIKNKRNDLKPCLDIETANFPVMDYTIRFINRFQQLCSLPLCIYVAPYFANEHLDARLTNFSCWIAHYGVKQPMATNIWGNNYAGHQYSEKGSVPGVSGNCDVNNFNSNILVSGSATPRLENSNPTTNEASIEDAREFVGDNCWTIQCMLNALGYSCGNTDGQYGVLTHNAVLKFQRENGLSVDGLAGPATLRKMQEQIRENVVSGKAYKTVSATKLIQAILGIHVDGVFWDDTEAAVVQFQIKHDLTPDGIVGYNTWTALFIM